jgi:hypothetical protein
MAAFVVYFSAIVARIVYFPFGLCVSAAVCSEPTPEYRYWFFVVDGHVAGRCQVFWGLDAPEFVTAMAEFVRTHPRTRMIVYYNGKPGSVFDRASKPAARAAYRRHIVPLANQ